MISGTTAPTAPVHHNGQRSNFFIDKYFAMSLFSKKRPTAAFVIFLLLCVACISCNKGIDKGTTFIKCVTCVNGGSCINDTCRCPVGYEGASCQTESRSKFTMEWTVSETSKWSGSRQYIVDIWPGLGDVNSIIIYNFHNNLSLVVSGYIAGDSI